MAASPALAPEIAKAGTEQAKAVSGLVTDLKVLLRKSGDLTKLRAQVALSVWNVRVAYKDYNPKAGSPCAKAIDAAMVAAGFAITSTTTPFQAEAIKAGREQFRKAVSYHVRKLADQNLTADQLKAAGFKPSSLLPDDQKLGKPSGEKGKGGKQKTAPASTPKLFDDLNSALAKLVGRAKTAKGDTQLLPKVKSFTSLVNDLFIALGVDARVYATSTQASVETSAAQNPKATGVPVASGE